MTFILVAVTIVACTAISLLAKSRRVKRTALMSLVVLLAVSCTLFLVGYFHGAFYTGEIFWVSPWVWLPFSCLLAGMLAAISQLRKLNRVQ